MSIFDRWLGRTAEPSSSSVAKQRLKIVLEYDRAFLSPGELDLIRKDIVKSISKHVRIEEEEVQVTLEEGSRLVAQIPLHASRGLKARPVDG